MADNTSDPVLEMLLKMRPAETSISRDQLLYEAGRQSRPRRSWVWPGVSVASWLVVGWLLIQHRQPGPVPSIPILPSPANPITETASEAPTVTEYSEYSLFALHQELDKEPKGLPRNAASLPTLEKELRLGSHLDPLWKP